MGVLLTSTFTMPQLNSAEEKAAREKLSDELSGLKKQIDDCSSKFEQAKAQQEQQKKKLQEFIEKSTAISQKMKAIQKERQDLFDKRDELNKSSSSHFKELPISNWKKDGPIEDFIEPNRVRIQKEMSDYQAQLLQIKNMSEERKYVGQINRLKNLELSLSDFEEKVRADQVGRDLADQYQAEAQAKKDELDRLYQEMQSLQDKITPLKETIDNLRSKMNAIGAERKEL